MKVLTVSHAHPDLSAGGGERAAYSLFRALKSRPGFESFFVAPVNRDSAEQRHGNVVSFRGRSDEALVSFPDLDHFSFQTQSQRDLRKRFEEIFSLFTPDIVHFQHFVRIGVDAFWIVKEILPRVKVMVTLHEYLLLCHNFGQMYKRSNSLCRQRTLSECSTCFPNIAPGDFFLRQSYFDECFRHVDQFHSPSHFLISQFERNGLPLRNVAMIENMQPFVTENRERGRSPRPSVAFFGQINQFKGIEVYCRAVEIMSRMGSLVDFNVFGSINKELNPALHDELIEWFREHRSICTFHGRYEGDRALQLMSSMDIIVIPSLWWENSPLVIQEGIAAGSWIIGSNIGGIAEKLSGYAKAKLFEVGDPQDLVRKIMEAVDNIERPAPPIDHEREMSDRLDGYLGLYHSLHAGIGL